MAPISISKPFGLKNNGSACYFNSLLQCLLTYPRWLDLANQEPNTKLGKEFKLILMQIKHIIKCKKIIGCAIESMIQESVARLQIILVNNLRTNYNSSISIYSQEDSQEAFVYLINELIKDQAFKSIKDWFEIKTQTDIICKDCLYSPNPRTEININCFVNNFNDWYDTSEDLTDYKCDRCSSKNCKTRNHIINTGSIMCIYLKDRYEKNDTFLTYPQIINICGKTYQLVSQLHHNGDLKSGHYYTCCYRGDNCYIIDDTSFKLLPHYESTMKIPLCNNVCFLFYVIIE